MDNIQSEIVKELQDTIDNMALFSEELETLDERFGRLDQRIVAMKSSLKALESQVIKGPGNIQEVFIKAEKEINTELQKLIRNIHIDIDGNYAKGQRLAIGYEDFNVINKEVAKIIKLQISTLVNGLQQQKGSLIASNAMEGLEMSISKGTIQSLVHKIKQEIVRKIQDPDIAETSEFRFTENDLSKVVSDVKAKLKAAFRMDEVSSDITEIPEEMERVLQKFVKNTVAGIDSAMRGKVEVPVNTLSQKIKLNIARNLNSTIDGLDHFLAVDSGSVSSTNLVRHLERQISIINDTLVAKIREQVDRQVSSILQDINVLSGQTQQLNPVQLPLVKNGSGEGKEDEGDSLKSGSSSGSSDKASSDNGDLFSGLKGEHANAVLKMLGSVVDVPKMLESAIERFKTVQAEQIRMTQTLLVKDKYQTTHADGTKSTDMSKVNTTLEELKAFARKTSVLYGTDYDTLHKVDNIGSKSLSEPVEIKKFVQLSAQLQAVDPGSNIINIANGLESVKSQFDLEMADMQSQIAEPLALLTSLTKAPVEQILDAVKQSSSKLDNTGIDARTAVILAGTTMKNAALEDTDTGKFYTDLIHKLQSNQTQSMLGNMGIAAYDIDKQTGAKMLKSGDQLFTELAEKLAALPDKTKNEAYDAIFGKDDTSKESTDQRETMDTFLELQKAMGSFGASEYDSMVTQSIDNPMVNANRAKASFTVAFDALIEEFTPAINTVSYALMNMAEGITANASMFAKLAEVVLTVMVGMRMLRGFRTGYNKLGLNFKDNIDIQKQRTSFLNNVNDLGNHAGNGVKSLSREDMSRMQRDPLLGRYIREFNGMNKTQQDHFKTYLGDNRIVVKDLPTLFTAMDEARNYTPREALSNNEKFNRHREVNSRLSTHPNSANLIDPRFLNSMNSSTMNPTAYNNHRANIQHYASVSDWLTSMTQAEFRGFEDHLAERRRNGMPVINSYGGMSQALEGYDSQRRQTDTLTRQSTPAFGRLSHSIRGVNDAMNSSSGGRFKNFLKGMPDLAKGASASIGGLSKNFAALGLEMAAAFVIAEAGKSILEASTLTDDQRALAKADDADNDEKGLANTLKAFNTDSPLNGKSLGNVAQLMLGSVSNGIARVFGGNEDKFGYSEAYDMIGELRDYYGFNDFGKWLKETGMTEEEAVDKFAEDTGRHKETAELRQKGYSEQYEKQKLKDSEEAELSRIAEENYSTKYKEGKLKFSSINADTANQNIEEGMNKVNASNQLETLRALMGGMKTDSEEYLNMRRQQVERIGKVMDDELTTIDNYIANAQSIMDNNEAGSVAYENAKADKEKLLSVRDKVQEENSAGFFQQKINSIQEEYQKSVGRVTKALQKIDLLSQAKELAAAYSMDNSSSEYYDTLAQISKNKIASMNEELANLQSIKASGDQSDELGLSILQQQNAIAGEQAKVKAYRLAQIGIGREKLDDHSSERENDLLELKLRNGNPDDSSPLIRNKRIANAKAEVSEISGLISSLKEKLPGALPDETVKINAEIRDLQKQALQTQLGILDEMKGTAGTFNMPSGVTAMSRYEYLTKGNTHNSSTIGMGDVTVNITMPNMTNGLTPSQVQQLGQSLGEGLSLGRIGGLRTQMLASPSYRS